MQITLPPELEEQRAKLEEARQQTERGELLSVEDFRKGMQAMKAEWAARQSA